MTDPAGSLSHNRSDFGSILWRRLAARRFLSVSGTSLSVIGIAANDLGVKRRRWVAIIVSRPKMKQKSRMKLDEIFVLQEHQPLVLHRIDANDL